MKSNYQYIFDIPRQQSEAFRQANYEWMLTHQHLFTHALTLTFDSKKIYAYLWQFSRSLTRNHPEMISRYQDSVKLFVNILDRSLFGNMANRFGSPLLFVPVMEGLNRGEIPHFHCSVGVPETRFEVFEEKVIRAWKRVPFSGFSVKVEPYRDAGWLGYTTKECKFFNRESIDWMNIRTPVVPKPVTTKS
jgi:hypothetical protein